MTKRVPVRIILLFCTLTLVLTGLTITPAAAATVVSVEGSAFGVEVTPSGSSVAIAPAPIVSFTNPSDGPGPNAATQSLAEAPSSGSTQGGFAKGQGMAVSTAQTGALGTAGAGVTSTADLDWATYLVDELVARKVHAECAATADGSSGRVTIGRVAFPSQGTFNVCSRRTSPRP